MSPWGALPSTAIILSLINSEVVSLGQSDSVQSNATVSVAVNVTNLSAFIAPPLNQSTIGSIISGK